MKNNRTTGYSIIAFILFLAIFISLSGNVYAGYCTCQGSYCDAWEYPETTEDYGNCIRCDCIPISNLCGNGYQEYAEQCDNGNSNTDQSCDPPYGGSCNYCDTQCQYHTVDADPCGNGVLESNLGEQCDAGNSNIDTVPTPAYGVTVDYCTRSCELKQINGSICGDIVVDLGYGEECDVGGTNGVIPNVTAYGDSKIYCTDTCKNAVAYGPSCGDGVVGFGEQCDGSVDTSMYSCISFGMIPDESSTEIFTCNSQCIINTGGCKKIDGWYVLSSGWNVIDNRLTALGSSNSIISDPFDMNVGKRYTLSANVETAGTVRIMLNSSCRSNITGRIENCAISAGEISFNANGRKSIDIILPANQHAMNDGTYFKDLRLLILVQGTATISNVSLKEATEYGIAYDVTPPSQLSGCCPSTYCWDGNACVDSSVWMNNASMDPIWNTVGIYDLEDNHVMSSDAAGAVGYRCIINNNTGSAEWTPSKIKYDWNYEKSGYCGRPTECFVDYENYFDPQASTRGCVSNGTIVDDNHAHNRGNHYCHEGNWTTKSYVIASLLQEISKNSPYTLSCYDDLSLTYNLLPADASNLGIISACVLTKPGDTQIVTGIVLQNDNPESINEFLTVLETDYNSHYTEFTATKLDCTSPDSADLIAGTPFARCMANTRQNNDLNVYYDTNYKYLIISNKPVTVIDAPGIFAKVWGIITNFFKGLFTRSSVITPYTTVGYTTSYDKIFILREVQGIQVTGIEESKYDEEERKIVTVLYVQYNATTHQNNTFNGTQINKSLEDAAWYNANKIIKTTYTDKEVVIKSDNRTGVWQYFTTILRINK